MTRVFSRPSVFKYLIHGWLWVYFGVIIKRMDAWIALDYAASKPCYDYKKSGNGIWYCCSLTVDPAFQGKGVGTALIEFIEQYACARGGNGIISVSKHFLGYDSWTNNDLQISVSESPKENILENVRFFKTFAKDIPVTMMSSVQFTHISDRPAVMLTDDLWGTSLRAWVGEDFKRPIAAIIDRCRQRHYHDFVHVQGKEYAQHHDGTERKRL